MSAPTNGNLDRFDRDAQRIPDLSEWLNRIAQGYPVIWASYVDYKVGACRVQK